MPRYQLEIEIGHNVNGYGREPSTVELSQMVGGVCVDVMQSLLKGHSSKRVSSGIHNKSISVYGVIVPTVPEMIADQSSR